MCPQESLIWEALETSFPVLSPFYNHTVKLIPPPSESSCVADAISKITIGQMLSRTAAATIYRRALDAAKADGHGRVWRLSHGQLRNVGLSERKSRTIKEFALRYDASPATFENWSSLRFDELRLEFGQFWGLSDWSCAMLSIFHFGQMDVFPSTDGTIKKAMQKIEIMAGAPLKPELASPYKTALSMLLWSCVDRQLI